MLGAECGTARIWAIPERRHPNLLLFPLFIHYTGALWQFRLSWKSRMQRCPPRVELGCQIARLRFLFWGGF